jgi:hypothetical protein
MRSKIFSRTARRYAAAITLLGFLTACGGSPTTETAGPAPAATQALGIVISPVTLTFGQSIPLPTEKPVFTMTGMISASNRAGALVFDRSTVERLGVHQVRLYEPWNKEDEDFRGVWLQDRIAVAGVKPEAVKLHIVALDDFTVDLTLADIRAGGIMLATRAGDGSMLPIDKGGPTRIVFLNGVKAGANADQWIWSIKAIDVQ